MNEEEFARALRGRSATDWPWNGRARAVLLVASALVGVAVAAWVTWQLPGWVLRDVEDEFARCLDRRDATVNGAVSRCIDARIEGSTIGRMAPWTRDEALARLHADIDRAYGIALDAATATHPSRQHVERIVRHHARWLSSADMHAKEKRRYLASFVSKLAMAGVRSEVVRVRRPDANEHDLTSELRAGLYVGDMERVRAVSRIAKEGKYAHEYNRIRGAWLCALGERGEGRRALTMADRQWVSSTGSAWSRIRLALVACGAKKAHDGSPLVFDGPYDRTAAALLTTTDETAARNALSLEPADVRDPNRWSVIAHQVAASQPPLNDALGLLARNVYDSEEPIGPLPNYGGATGAVVRSGGSGRYGLVVVDPDVSLRAARHLERLAAGAGRATCPHRNIGALARGFDVVCRDPAPWLLRAAAALYVEAAVELIRRERTADARTVLERGASLHEKVRDELLHLTGLFLAAGLPQRAFDVTNAALTRPDAGSWPTEVRVLYEMQRSLALRALGRVRDAHASAARADELAGTGLASANGLTRPLLSRLRDETGWLRCAFALQLDVHDDVRGDAQPFCDAARRSKEARVEERRSIARNAHSYPGSLVPEAYYYVVGRIADGEDVEVFVDRVTSFQRVDRVTMASRATAARWRGDMRAAGEWDAILRRTTASLGNVSGQALAELSDF